jgi:beta-lactamase class A
LSVSWAVDGGAGPVGVDADRVVPAASTIKVLLAVAAARRFADGRLDAAEVATAVPGTGEPSLLAALPGLDLRLGHLVTFALAVSDNAVTNVLLDRIGLEAVTAEGESLGLRDTRVSRRMLDWDAVDAGRDNLTTAADLTRVLRALVDGTLPPEATRPVLHGLRASQHLDVLGEIVSEDRYLGSKRGVNDRANHDCGLVAGEHGPVAVAVCSSPPASPDALRAAARSALSRGGALRSRRCRSCRPPGWRP